MQYVSRAQSLDEGLHLSRVRYSFAIYENADETFAFHMKLLLLFFSSCSIASRSALQSSLLAISVEAVL